MMTVVWVGVGIELLLEFAEGEAGEEELLLAEGLSELLCRGDTYNCSKKRRRDSLVCWFADPSYSRQMLHATLAGFAAQIHLSRILEHGS